MARSLGTQLVVPALIGFGTGACVAGASGLVEEVALKRLALLPSGIPALFSLVALVATELVVRFVTRASHPATAEVYILAFHHPNRRIPLREVPGRVLAAVATVSFGGSQGLESPSALIGSSLGQIAAGRMGKLVSADERRSWMIAGASAGIAAVFSSPGVGTLYGLEVPFRRDVDAPRLVPAAVAAGCAYLTRDALIGARHLVTLGPLPALDATFTLGCLLTALGCGFGARLFAFATQAVRQAGTRLPPWLRAASAGALLAVLAWAGHALSGHWITFGPGYIAAEWLTSGDHAWWLVATMLVIRTAGTLTCVYGGGGGGVFTSLACTGVFIGEIVAHVLGRTEGRIFPMLGAACFLASGYRIPLAGMLLVAETTGNLLLTVAGLVVIGIGQVLIGDLSVSDAQRAERPGSGS
jgi:CIC family chloride channel protein